MLHVLIQFKSVEYIFNNVHQLSRIEILKALVLPLAAVRGPHCENTTHLSFNMAKWQYTFVFQNEV